MQLEAGEDSTWREGRRFRGLNAQRVGCAKNALGHAIMHSEERARALGKAV